MTRSAFLDVNGVRLEADPAGALIWPTQRLLAVADLHLEKGSSFQGRGYAALPPYDTAATLNRLSNLLEKHRPRTVLCLGDSFHDSTAVVRLAETDRDRIRAMTGAVDWIWLAGNHDPAPPSELGGRNRDEYLTGNLIFRHIARHDRIQPGEISGHFHPKASVRVRGRRLTAPCFASDGRRLIMPAFGAYTGGLNLLTPAIRHLFTHQLTAYLLGRSGVYAYPQQHLAP